jgi:hypothetical protein
MSMLVPFVWKTPDNWADIALLSSLGVFGGVGHYCVARAYDLCAGKFHRAHSTNTQMIGSVMSATSVRRNAGPSMSGSAPL